MAEHDGCVYFPCDECQAELKQCPGCGDYLYDADVESCESCDELMQAIVKNKEDRDERNKR